MGGNVCHGWSGFKKREREKLNGSHPRVNLRKFPAKRFGFLPYSYNCARADDFELSKWPARGSTICSQSLKKNHFTDFPQPLNHPEQSPDCSNRCWLFDSPQSKQCHSRYQSCCINTAGILPTCVWFLTLSMREEYMYLLGTPMTVKLGSCWLRCVGREICVSVMGSSCVRDAEIWHIPEGVHGTGY